METEQEVGNLGNGYLTVLEDAKEGNAGQVIATVFTFLSSGGVTVPSMTLNIRCPLSGMSRSLKDKNMETEFKKTLFSSVRVKTPSMVCNMMHNEYA